MLLCCVVAVGWIVVHVKCGCALCLGIGMSVEMLAGLLCDEIVNIVHAVVAQQRKGGDTSAISGLAASKQVYMSMCKSRDEVCLCQYS